MVQSLNVFGSDKFTALAVNFGAAAIAVFVAWGVPLGDSLQTLILGVVAAVLGLFARNGVTNQYATDGTKATQLWSRRVTFGGPEGTGPGDGG